MVNTINIVIGIVDTEIGNGFEIMSIQVCNWHMWITNVGWGNRLDHVKYLQQ